ncbi:MAG: DMT family transporter [Flavobacteriales bacterium]|nr:DMT family transporter [Flavobacteriales bacterium]
MKSRRAVNLILLHFLVFIWGFTGILGYEISLSPLPLVWWRVFIASAALLLFSVVMRKKISASLRDMIYFSGVGIIIALHWLCFFGSIKESTISVALVVISTTAFFVSLISPWIRREKFHYYELFLGILVVLGLAVIFRFESQYTKGIILSLLSALFAATFSTLNSLLIVKHTALKIAFWEVLTACLALTVFLAFRGDMPAVITNIGLYDLMLLLILGIICTGFAFVAGIEVMKVLSPFTCALAINLEPVYTILLALLFYGENEYMSPQFYLGAVIILSTLFIEAFMKRKQMVEQA